MANTDGRSRVPEILAAARGQTAPDPENAVIAHLDQTWGQRVQTTSPNVAVREGSYRYIQFRNPKGKIAEQLFDSARDAREVKNLLAADGTPEDKAVGERMRAQVESYLTSKPVWQGETKPLELDELQLNQLRALGYNLP